MTTTYGEFQHAPLVLASKSPARAGLLRAAGLKITTAEADIDERSVEAAVGSDLEGEDLALILAQAKAANVAPQFADTHIIGADQTLTCEGRIIHKAEDDQDLRKKLLWLSGRTHTLSAALVVVYNGETVWQHTSQAHMTMRILTPEFVGRYVAATRPDSLDSVGGYQLEGPGSQLFDSIDGDYFTILGLPLLPLLAWLRSEKILIS
uniref:Maf family protein n=1 Tax=Pararhizobium sp. IMCC3301 TaxID=3067904 RepID=UPI002741C48A|nr:Maf family protein [Pararhizobium sp. IMCC3301]